MHKPGQTGVLPEPGKLLPRAVAAAAGIALAAFAAAVLLTGQVLAGDPGPGGPRLGGTGSGTALLATLARDYAAANPGGAPECLLPPLGSTGGLRALAAGRVDVVVLGREQSAEEELLGLSVTPWAKTPLVLATSTGVRPAGFDAASLAAVLRGQIAAWDDGSDIRLVLRFPSESDSLALAELSPDIKNALDFAMARPGAVMADTDLDAVDLLARTKGSLGTTTLGLLKVLGAKLRPLAFDGVDPGAARPAGSGYPLVKTLYLAHARDPGPAARKFLDWLFSPQARARLIELGHEPLFP